MSNNPQQLQLGDKVYLVQDEKNKIGIPIYLCYYWHEISSFSPHGFPQINTGAKKYNVRPNNIRSIERYEDWVKKYNQKTSD